MLRATPGKGKRKGLRNTTDGLRFLGVVADARALGVDRVHLWRVLTGRRASATLLARYRNLKSSQLKEAA